MMWRPYECPDIRSMLSAFAFAVFGLVLWVSGRVFRRRPLSLPPGPKGLPIVGYLPFLRRDLHIQLMQMAKIHGPVFRLQLGSKTAVVLASTAAVKDALRLAAFSDRPTGPFTDFLEGYGIVNSNGDVWRKQRRFTHEVLRNFGMKTFSNDEDKIANIISTEVKALLHCLNEQRGAAYDAYPVLACCVSNVISSILMRVRFEPRDPIFVRLLSLIDDGFRLFSVIAPANFVPPLRLLPGMKTALEQLQANRDEMFVFFRDVIEKHKAALDAAHVRDFIDAYLVEMEKEEADSEEAKHFTEKQLYQILGDMFSSGLESMAVTLQWLLLFVATHPHIQERVQDELDRVVGRTRFPSLKDLPSLPFTEATILETQRRASVLAIAPAHSTSRNIQFHGYDIPRDTLILPLLWAVHMDPNIWQEPERFDPNRFIGDDGHVIRPDSFMPFGTGRRMCLAATLAKHELFIIVSCLLHQFHVRIPEGEPQPTFDAILTTTLSPRPFKVCFIHRENSIPIPA